MALPSNSPLRAAGRKHPEVLEEIVTPNTVAKVKYKILRSGSDLRFEATVVHNDGTSDIEYPIADTRGRLKVFGDLDQVVRQVTAIYGVISGMEMVCTNAAVMNPVESVPNDPLVPIRREKAYLEKQLPIATAAETSAVAQLAIGAPFQNGTPAQQARYAQFVAVKNACTEYKGFLTDEIARLTALLPA